MEAQKSQTATSVDAIRSDIEVASGRIPADILLRNGRFLDVFTGEIRTGDLAVRNGRVVALGPAGVYRGKIETDLKGRIAVPGIIDAHVHIESSLLGPAGFAGITVPHGTTTVIADPHEIANVCGMAGIKWMLDASENVPQSVFVMLPSSVPATSLEDAGAVLEASDLADLMNHPRVLGLGEAMDYPAVTAAEKSIVDKIALARKAGKRIDGHSPGVKGMALAAYAAAGIGTDHECSSIEEMKDRLSMGMRILIREGTAARDLASLVKGVDSSFSRRCAFCTDDKLAGDILSEGHIDFNIRKAIKLGIPAVDAVRMATLNAAEAFGLEDQGAIAPGRRADLVLLDGELTDFRPVSVFRGGELVAENGELLRMPSDVDNSPVLDTIRMAPLGRGDLDLSIPSGRAHVISLSSGSLVTGDVIREVPIDAAGLFQPRPETDLVKLVVVERHKATGLIGLGIVEGYGIHGGAVASSIAHDSHNLIIAGDDDAAIFAALQAVSAGGGGISLAASGGELLGVLPLPLGGLMTDAPGTDTTASLENLLSIARDRLGVSPDIDPFMTLSFLALPVIPDLKLTARGLFDVKAFKFVSIEA